MLTKANVMKTVFGFLALALFVFPSLSYADWSIGIGIGDHRDRGYYHDRDDHRYYRWHDRPQYGWHLHFLPAGYFTIWVGGVRYYYYDGLYYSYVGNGDYVLVNPPMGAYVDAIPSDFRPVMINGETYYTDNGVYYIFTRHHGYKVVAMPMVYAQPAPVVIQQPQQVVVAQPPVPVAVEGSFTINVPNSRGGYTPVVITRSGNGYVGPQGEFYATFPSVAQLKTMYGK